MPLPSAAPALSPLRLAKRHFSLKVKLTGMMLLTISAIAAIVHIPWVYISRQNVKQMVSVLHDEAFQGAQNDAAAFFDNVLAIQHIILSSLDNGLIDIDDPTDQGRLYLNLLHAHENITWVQIGFANGDFLGAQRRDDGLYNLDQRRWDGTLGQLAEPGTDLAAQQRDRAQQAEIFEQTQDANFSPGQLDWQVRTYDFIEEDDAWQQVDQTRREEFYFAPQRPYYEEAVAQPGESVWTDVYRFRTGNVVGLDAAITYNDPETGALRGVVSISFGLRRISEYLSDLKQPGEGLLFIVDSDGNLVAASDPAVLASTFESETEAELLALAAIDNPLLQVVNQSLLEHDVALAELVDLQELSQYDPITGERYYVAVSPLGRLDWVIGSITPETVFLEQIDRNQQRLLIIILVLLGGGMIILWQLSDRLLIRPIVSISNAAIAMESGNFEDVSLTETAQRDDELGRLAEVFQNMAAVIGDREQSLMAQLEDLRDSGSDMAGSQLEVAYYQALTARATQLRAAAAAAASPAFPPADSLSAYYRALKERAAAVRVTRISGVEVEQMLRQEEYLASLPDGDLRELASGAQRQTFEAGELIFREGDAADTVYVLAVGTVEVRSTSDDSPLRVLQPGQIFGDLTLMLDVPRTASVRPRDHTVVFTLDEALFSRILRHNPQAMPAVEAKLMQHQDVLADAQIWLGEGQSQLAAGATWRDLASQQLQQWWQGQLVEHSRADRP